MGLIRLACGSCGESGTWTCPDCAPQLITLPSGEQVTVVGGRCSRCGSRNWCEPSETAVAEIGERVQVTRTRTAQLRKTMQEAAHDGH